MTESRAAILRAHDERLAELTAQAESGAMSIGVAIGFAALAGAEYERKMTEQVERELAELRLGKVG